MGFWKRDELKEIRAANPDQTAGMSDRQLAEWADRERAAQERALTEGTKP